MKRLLLISILVCGCGDNVTPPPERDAYEGPETTQLDCVPNLDGTVTADELPIGLGAEVTYRINPSDSPRAIDLVGLVDQNGVQVWDWSTDDDDDQALTLSPRSLSDTWFAGSFPTGEFVAPLDAGKTIDGVYRKSDAAIVLLGYASKEEDDPDGKTLVVYDEPVVVYSLPLKEGDTWVSVGETSNATIRDLPYAGRDIYTVTVDATGEIWLPDLKFENALRVRTELSIEPAVGEGLSRSQVSFLFECFGEVARAVSADNETEENFSTAVELRRLGF